MASRAHRVQSSPDSPVRSPYDERTPRVSSPEVERALPGPYASTSVTLRPRWRRLSAVKLPQAPAPMTTTSDAAVADRTPDECGTMPGTRGVDSAEPPTSSAPA